MLQNKFSSFVFSLPAFNETAVNETAIDEAFIIFAMQDVLLIKEFEDVIMFLLQTVHVFEIHFESPDREAPFNKTAIIQVVSFLQDMQGSIGKAAVSQVRADCGD